MGLMDIYTKLYNNMEEKLNMLAPGQKKTADKFFKNVKKPEDVNVNREKDK